MPLNKTSTIKSRLAKSVLALSIVLPLSLTAASVASAGVVNCKINVVGGSYKGRSFPVQINNGQFTGMSNSGLPGCRAKKKVYGRWYHLCKRGTLIVYKRKNFKWVKLYPKSLLKYQHTCF